MFKQLVHSSAVLSLGYETHGKFVKHSGNLVCSRLRLEQLSRFYRALQTSSVFASRCNDE